MCRMFAYVGSSRKELDVLFSALKKASVCDACIKAMIPGHDGWHQHGWGYVIRTSDQLFHYRSTNAVDQDDHRLPVLKGEIHAIFHARLSTGGVLGDPAFSHPYVASTNQALFFLAHNGGLQNAAQIVPNKVDSEWALDQIVREGDLGTALPRLKENTSSALNLLLLTDNRETRKATITYLNWYHGHGDKQRDGYYRMYQAAMTNGGQAVFSSTMEPLLRRHIVKGSNQPVAYGELQTLSLAPG